MKTSKEKNEQLTALLSIDIELEPPVWLKKKIMVQLSSLKPMEKNKKQPWIAPPFILPFKSVRLTAILSIIMFAFWGGIQLERSRTNRTALAENYETAREYYLTGRKLLADHQVHYALQLFGKAVKLAPKNAEFNHWEAVANWAVGNSDLERQSYIKNIETNPHYLPSLLNLGHNYLENGNYNAALRQYHRVLQSSSNAPEALFNSALAYIKLNNSFLARESFEQYLETFRTGKWAHRALAHLHELDDYSFRSYRIGINNIIVNVDNLLQVRSTYHNKEVEILAQAFNRTNEQELHIVVYNKDLKNEAKKTAISLRNHLLEKLGSHRGALVKVSWFGTDEMIIRENRKNLYLTPTVLIFSNSTTLEKRRRST